MGTMVRTSVPRGLECAGGWALVGGRCRRSSLEQRVCTHPWVFAHRPVFLCVACSIYRTTVPTERRLKQALPSCLPVHSLALPGGSEGRYSGHSVATTRMTLLARVKFSTVSVAFVLTLCTNFQLLRSLPLSVRSTPPPSKRLFSTFFFFFFFFF